MIYHVKEQIKRQIVTELVIKLMLQLLILIKNKKNFSFNKAREIEEEKKAMAEYGSSDSGASLGDILGAHWQKKMKNLLKRCYFE